MVVWEVSAGSLLNFGDELQRRRLSSCTRPRATSCTTDYRLKMPVASSHENIGLLLPAASRHQGGAANKIILRASYMVKVNRRHLAGRCHGQSACLWSSSN